MTLERQSGEITGLLNAPSGEEAESPDHLWELVYPELRRRARGLMRGERVDHTLSATGVVNEAFMRLATLGPREWEDRSHFYATASGIMRNVLIDHARARAAVKRGAGGGKVPLSEELFAALPADDEGFFQVTEVLDRLAEKHERAALVVSFRVFGGLSVEETAIELGVSERTVKADWAVARARLQKLLRD